MVAYLVVLTYTVCLNQDCDYSLSLQQYPGSKNHVSVFIQKILTQAVDLLVLEFSSFAN